MKRLIAIVLSFLAMNYQNALACADSDDMAQLKQIESEKLLSNAPTFKQAWIEKTISIKFTPQKTVDNQCMASFEIQLPQKDIDEATQHLDQNPAKRILLAAQGYAVPDKISIETPFYYQMTNGKVVPSELKNSELKSLHNNLEYTYQLLAQLRANVDEKSVNETPWRTEEINAAIQTCRNKQSSKSEAVNFCPCRIEQLSKNISAKQMELINYTETQPFSVATGSLNGFQKLSEKVNHECSKK
jgi:hypothetical protein